MRKTIFAMLVMAFVLNHNLCNAKDIKNSKRILSGGGYDSSLSLVVENHCVYLEVEHSNTGKNLIYISSTDPIFIIRDSHGKVLRYTGPVAREPIQELSSFKKLLPGQSHNIKIFLNKYYGIHQPGEYVATLNLDYYDPASHNSTYRGSVSLSFDTDGVCNIKP
jgi:hypothetical protein